jgi:hypothetical protein
MITKRIETGKIEILVDGQIQLRQDTVIEEDGVELSRTYHRTVLEPGTDVTDHADPRIAAVANVLWTPDVVSTFATAQAAAAATAINAVKG